MASIAARTFFEMRRAGSGSAGGGLSRAASARLAGVPGGVTFFHVRHRRRLPMDRNGPPASLWLLRPFSREWERWSVRLAG